MTYDECMARLMACPALPRGERGANADVVGAPSNVLRHWPMLVASAATLGGRYFTGPLAGEMARAEWRRWAAPLRRAREEGQFQTHAAKSWRQEAEDFERERDALRAEVARLKDPDTLRNVNARDNIARIKNLHAALEEALGCCGCFDMERNAARIRAIASGDHKP